MLNRLRAGAAEGACGVTITRLDALDRLALNTTLMFGRMEYKLQTIREVYQRAGGDWNMTFFVMFLRTLGDVTNREAYMRLAWKVTCSSVLHERSSVAAIEALLLGCSGLLKCYPEDRYTRSLAAEFAHLSHKYSIEPMSADEWSLRRVLPMNHPALRLAQTAAFFAAHDMACSEAVECRTADDVEKLFGNVAASDCRLSHFAPGDEPEDMLKRLGRTKMALLGINLVAPMQFAYGELTGNEEVRERAMELLENIAAEDNRYMRRWAAYGAEPQNAFESQALLELALSYCDRGRCEECPLGRKLLKKTVEGTDDGPTGESIGLRSL